MRVFVPGYRTKCETVGEEPLPWLWYPGKADLNIN